MPTASRVIVEATLDSDPSQKLDVVFQATPRLAAFLEFNGFTLAEAVYAITDGTVKVPSVGQPFDAVLNHKLSASIGLLQPEQKGGKPNVQGKVVFGPSLDKPDPIEIEVFGIKIAVVRSITLDYVGGKVQMSADADILGRKQALEYPFPPTPPATPPLIKFEYLGIGQRVAPPVGSPPSIPAVIKALEDAMHPVPGGDLSKIAAIYNPDVNWMFGVDVTVRDVLRAQIVLADPVLYGLALSMTTKALAGLRFEILYRKVSDEVGQFYAKLTLPAQYRTLQFGAASVTLPTIAIGVYTNGDFEIELGWPLGDGSLTVQVLPFTGSGGLRFAKLSGATAQNVPPSWKSDTLIIEFGIAFSIGLGKSINAGILSASFSIQLVGVFQGRLGWSKPAGELASGNGQALVQAAGDGLNLRAPNHFWFQGTFGIVGVIQGTVYFVVVKASLSAVVRASVTVTFSNDADTLIVVNAYVSLNITVEIGGFRIFGKWIGIRVSFSFSADLTQRFVIPRGSSVEIAGPRRLTGLPALTAAYDAEPLTLGLRAPAPPSVEPLTLWVVPQVTKAGPTVQIVLGLAIQTDGGQSSDFGKLVDALARRLVGAHADVDADVADLVELDYDDLVTLSARLALMKERNQPAESTFDYQAIVQFLSDNFAITVTQPPATGPTPNVAVFPMLGELLMSYTGGPANGIHFADVNPRSDAYVADLQEYIDSLQLVEAPIAGAGAVQDAVVDDDLTAFPELVAQDWFAIVLNGIPHQLMRHVEVPGGPDGRPRSISLADAEIDYATIGAQASRFLQHGLAVPAAFPADPKTWPQLEVDALGVLTEQQIALPDPQPTFELSLTTADPKPAWLTADLNVQLGDTSTLEALAAWTVPPGSPTSQALPGLSSSPLEFMLASSIPWTVDGAVHPIVALSGPAGAYVADAGGSTNARLTPDTATNTANDEAAPVEFQACTVVPLTLRRVRSATSDTVSPEGQPTAFLPHLYQLGGADEAARLLLEQVVEHYTGMITRIHVAYPAATGIESAPLGPSVRLVKTNLSTLSGPPTLLEDRKALGPEDVNWALITDPPDFLRLVVECSIVNSGGYFLWYEDQAGDDLPASLWKDTETIDIQLVVAFTPGTAAMGLVTSANNGLAIVPGTTPAQADAASQAPTTWHLEPLASDGATPVPQWGATTPAGCLAFEVARDDPDGVNWQFEWQREVAKLFNVVRYRVLGGGGFETSNWGPPLGPGTPEGEETTGWLYQQAVRAWPLASGGPGGNRYAPTGQDVTVQFRIADVFGNLLEDADQVPLLTEQLRYWDRLLPIEAWPGVHAEWSVPSTGTVDIALSFKGAEVVPPAGSAGDTDPARHNALASALDTWQLIRDQLDDPKLAGSAVCTTLAPAAPVDVLPTLSGFAADVVTSITAAIQNATTPADVGRNQDVSVAPSTTQDLFELTVTLTIERDAALVGQQDGKPFGPAACATSEIAAAITPTSGPTDLTQFAKAFESGFPGLKLALGTPDAGSTQSSLWAYRIAAPTAGTATYLAPAPLCTKLVDGTWPVRVYDETLEDPVVVDRAFADVDLDVWARAMLNAFDDFLSPAIAADVAWVAAQPEAQGEMQTQTAYDALMTAKSDLASAISKTVWPVFVGEGDPDVTAARAAFEQQLLKTLASAYDVSTIVQVPITAAALEAVTLYGPVSEPPPTLGPAATPPKVNYTVGRVATGPERTAPTLNVLVTPADPTAEKTHDTDLTFDITFVEHDFGKPDPSGYIPSSWLKFAVPADPKEGASPLSVPLGRLSIPIPLRQYPPAPSLTSQDSAGTVTDLASAATWDYRFTYVPSRAAQDSVAATVTFNPPPVSPARALADGEGDERRPASCLFEALARFESEYAALAAEFAAIHRAANGDQSALPLARRVIADVLALFKDAADTWLTPLPPNGPTGLAHVSGLQPLVSDFRVDPQNDRSIIDVRVYQRPDRSWPAWPVIDGFERTGESAAPGAAPEVAYREAMYKAVGVPPANRAIRVVRQQVAELQTANVALSVERNIDFEGKRTTDPRFVYETAQITAPGPIAPANVLAGGAAAPAASTLPRALGRLFATLLSIPEPQAEPPPRGRIARLLRRRPRTCVVERDENAFAWPVTVAVEYTYAVGQLDDEPIEAVYPVVMRSAYPFTAADADPANAAGLVCQLSAAIESWYTAVAPGQGSLDFEVVLFAGAATEAAQANRAALAHLLDVEVAVPNDVPASWWAPG